MIELTPKFNTEKPFHGEALKYSEMIIRVNDILFETWKDKTPVRIQRDEYINHAMMMIALLEQNPNLYFLGQYIQHIENSMFVKKDKSEKDNLEDLRLLTECLETARQINTVYKEICEKYKGLINRQKQWKDLLKQNFNMEDYIWEAEQYQKTYDNLGNSINYTINETDSSGEFLLKKGNK